MGVRWYDPGMAGRVAVAAGRVLMPLAARALPGVARAGASIASKVVSAVGPGVNAGYSL